MFLFRIVVQFSFPSLALLVIVHGEQSLYGAHYNAAIGQGRHVDAIVVFAQSLHFAEGFFLGVVVVNPFVCADEDVVAHSQHAFHVHVFGVCHQFQRMFLRGVIDDTSGAHTCPDASQTVLMGKSQVLTFLFVD